MNNKIKEVHVVLKGLPFPFLIFVSSDKEHAWVQNLCNVLKTLHFDTFDLCKWCISHNIRYEIFVTERDMRMPFKRRYYQRILKQVEDYKSALYR